MSSPKVHAIIVTYNGMKWIEKCLSSLMNSSITPNILVIDNCSTDGTCEFIEESFPKITLIKNEKNLGFGKSNNIGIIKATQLGADFIVLVNQDVWIEKNTINVLLSIFSDYPDYGILTGIHFDGLKEELDYNFSKLLHPDITPDFISDFIVGTKKSIYESTFINAAFWVIKKDCFVKVGLFEPLFKMYGEDNNYVQRLYFNGFKLGLTPLTSICHDRKKRMGNFSVNVDEVQLNFLLNILNPNIKFLKAYVFSFLRLLNEIFKALFNLKVLLSIKYFKLIILNFLFSYKFLTARNKY